MRYQLYVGDLGMYLPRGNSTAQRCVGNAVQPDLESLSDVPTMHVKMFIESKQPDKVLSRHLNRGHKTKII